MSALDLSWAHRRTRTRSRETQPHGCTAPLHKSWAQAAHERQSVTTVREVVFSDFESWLPLWKGYQEFYKINIPLEETKLTWARFLDPGEPMRAALAFDGTTAVGMVTMIVHRSTWTAKNIAYLEDLYTEPNQRARGVGRTLIEWGRDRAL